jgi:hypothetical protein
MAFGCAAGGAAKPTVLVAEKLGGAGEIYGGVAGGRTACAGYDKRGLWRVMPRRAAPTCQRLSSSISKASRF